MPTAVEYPPPRQGAGAPAQAGQGMLVPPGGQPPAPDIPARPPGTLGRLSRRVHLRTIPARMRAVTAAAIVAVLLLFGVASWAIGNARTGLEVIGHDAGPQVVATGDLYYALNDMDAQVANILLIGREQNLGRGRAASERMYEQRRREANNALLQAAQLAGEDETERETVRRVLVALGQYERLAGQAMQLNDQQAHAPGPPTQPALDRYRQATDLMKLELLPQAYNLTLDSGTIVRKTYESKQSSVADGRFWLLAAGLLLVGVLLALQLYLARRFRRLVNPALALATLGTLVLTLAGAALLNTQANKLDTAKVEGFDSVLALSRARAISNSAYADATRYLLDPQRADTYEQVYFDKSQQILYLDADRTKNLGDYYTNLDAPVNGYTGGQDMPAPVLGFLGDQARQADAGRERDAVAKVLRTYRGFQQGDRQIRGLVGRDQSGQAIVQHTGRSDFAQYDQALRELAQQHRDTFTGAIEDGDGALSGWNVVLPAATLAIIVLILVGVRPRLAEYR